MDRNESGRGVGEIERGKNETWTKEIKEHKRHEETG